jgi:hypothetical protein
MRGGELLVAFGALLLAVLRDTDRG